MADNIYDTWQELNDDYYNGAFLNPSTMCYVQVQFGNTNSPVKSKRMFLPVYPLDISNSFATNYASSTIIGRTGQISAYNSTNDVTTSFNLHLHRELRVYNEGDNKIDEIVSLIESAQYPYYDTTSGHSYAPIVTYKFGDTLIRGKQTSANTQWSGPKIDGKYMECTINISVTNLPNKVIDYNDIVSTSPRGGGRW